MHLDSGETLAKLMDGSGGGRSDSLWRAVDGGIVFPSRQNGRAVGLRAGGGGDVWAGGGAVELGQQRWDCLCAGGGAGQVCDSVVCDSHGSGGGAALSALSGGAVGGGVSDWGGDGAVRGDSLCGDGDGGDAAGGCRVVF